MSAITKVLVPVDFSECSWLALNVAAGLAERLAVTVDVVHVWDLPRHRRASSTFLSVGGSRAYAERVLDDKGQEIEKLLAGLSVADLDRVHSRIEKGHPARTIVALSEEYDLLLMGTHGRTGLAQVLMGSVAERVVRRARCPVLTTRHPRVIHGHYVDHDGIAIRRVCRKDARVLAAVDFSSCSRVALQRTIGLADDLGAQVHVLHVVEPPRANPNWGEPWPFRGAGPTTRALRAQAESELAEFVGQVDRPVLPLTQSVAVGHASGKIVARAQSGGYDLLTLGTHGRSGLSHLWLGSIAEQVVRRSPCPVLTVREPSQPRRARPHRPPHSAV